MKKIFTLIAATILTVASFAADRRPVVTLKSSRNYEIVIDGRSFYNNSGIMDLTHMQRGQHTIKVFEVNRGRRFGLFFGRSKRLVDASTFLLRNNDVDILVDFRGQIRISEDRFGHDRRDRDWRDEYGHDRGRDDRDWNRNF